MSDGVREKRRICRKTCDKPHYPYELPKGWEWCKLGDIAYVASGSTPEKSSFVSEGIPYIKMYNLRNQKIDFDYKPQYIKEEVHNGKLQRSRTEIGDLIMNIVGPPLGKLALIPKSLPQANFNQAAVLIRPYLHKDIINIYLKAYLEEMSEINSISTKGSAGQINISLTQSQNMRIPLPPLQEQIRIINELRVWLTSVQQIEDGRETLNLVMRQTKSKILDLAIHGKLVPQDPTDEPASELLKRINPKAEITCDNPQYENLPNGWCWTTIEEIGEIVTGSTPSKDIEAYYGGNIPFFKPADLEEGIHTASSKDRLTSLGFEQSRKLPIGSILVTCIGATIGKTGLTVIEGACNQQINAIIPRNVILPHYLYCICISDYMQNEIKTNASATTLPILNKGNFSKIILPLPPLQEQHRIFAKIEELFAQLDNIASSL